MNALHDLRALPRADVYSIEKRTFDLSGIRRTREIPVDLLLAPGYYFLFNLLIGLFTGSTTFNSDDQSTESLIANYVIIALFGLFFVMASVRLALRYKARVSSGDC